VVILVLTYSRAGLINLIALAFIGLLFFRPRQKKMVEQNQTGIKIWTRRLAEAGIVIVILSAIIFLTGTKNTFFSRMWSYFTVAKDASISDYFEYIGFSARFAYGEAAYKTYEAYPTLGVGVGNYAFYFEEMLPDEPIATTPELLRLVTPEAGRNRLITPKNFYFRILAETGLVGAAAFVAYLVAILGCALSLWVVAEVEHKFWGKAGLLGLFAFALSAFSFDSFAIPNMWVVFGLITSAAWIYFRLDRQTGIPSTHTLPQETL
jgi:O-antigen ligase